MGWSTSLRMTGTAAGLKAGPAMGAGGRLSGRRPEVLPNCFFRSHQAGVWGQQVTSDRTPVFVVVGGFVVVESNWMAGDSRRSEGRAIGGAPGPIWLVTFGTYRRRGVFANPRLWQSCADALREVADRNGYRVYALAILPDHVHIVLDSGTSAHGAPKVLNNLKGVAARRVFQASPELKLDLGSHHLWTAEYQAKALPDPPAVERACRYVEDNPVRMGWPRQRFPWLISVRPSLSAG